MATQYLPVSWNKYHSLAQSLAAKILQDKKQFDEIVAISRGGLTLGHLLTDFLQIPISTIAIQSYSGIWTQGELKITKVLQTDIADKDILLVDDVSDTGKTLSRAISYLQDFHPKSIITATMFYKPHSKFLPNYIAAKTRRWILFPHDATEMIPLITKDLQKQGKTAKQISLFLKSLHYADSQIAFVEKYYP